MGLSPASFLASFGSYHSMMLFSLVECTMICVWFQHSNECYFPRLIASDTPHNRWTCAIPYFWRIYPESSILSLRPYAVACAETMALLSRLSTRSVNCDVLIRWSCSLICSSSSSVCLVFFPLSLCLVRWFWLDLMNGRHNRTTAVCVSLWSSGFFCVVLLPAGSWHGLPRW